MNDAYDLFGVSGFTTEGFTELSLGIANAALHIAKGRYLKKLQSGEMDSSE